MLEATEVYVELVREFYSNMHDVSIQELTFSTFVRGHELQFDSDILASYMNIEETVMQGYPPVLDTVDYRDVTQAICGTRREWLFNVSERCVGCALFLISLKVRDLLSLYV
ncbi:hypothetical protein U1Q18_019546 [Sarracenia purpurea var. burkii]